MYALFSEKVPLQPSHLPLARALDSRVEYSTIYARALLRSGLITPLPYRSCEYYTREGELQRMGLKG
jgi:hypothetical protein